MSANKFSQSKRNSPAAWEFVFGGTFDPVHLGHQAIVSALLELAPDVPVRIIPCAVSPLKETPSAEFAHRHAMLKLAYGGVSEVIIDSREQNRPPPSYTVDTLESLIADNPTTAFVFVMGADSLDNVQAWSRWQQLAKLCHLVVLNRPNYPFKVSQGQLLEIGFDLVSEFCELKQLPFGCAIYLTMPEQAHSSTNIRAAIANNAPLDSMLAQSVIEYIRNHHLYERN